MNRRFLSSLFVITLVFSSLIGSAQGGAADLYSKARKFMNQGILDSAELYLDKALALAPGQLDMLEDQVYLQVLKRDFAKAMELSNPLVVRPDASVKTFQVVGMVYKEIADIKSAKKMYDHALLKFPNSGLLYSEYADLYAGLNKKSEAIKLWEKGIEVDPNHSSNYYHAALYYAENNNPVWALLYGETFVNIESLSNRTSEMKSILTDMYKKISTPGYLNSKNNPFAFAVAGTFSRQQPINMNNISVINLTSMRMGFVKDWYQKSQSKLPFRLFEYHDQLIKEGLFEAYNQWLFGASLNVEAYNAWVATNKERMDAFRNFTGGRVYKIPAGQYYQTRF